jgi:hypothetical protein
MKFTFQTLHYHSNDMISVRVVAESSPCGTLVFTTDEWLAFNALVLARSDRCAVIEVVAEGADALFERLRKEKFDAQP